MSPPPEDVYGKLIYIPDYPHHLIGILGMNIDAVNMRDVSCPVVFWDIGIPFTIDILDFVRALHDPVLRVNGRVYLIISDSLI